MTTTTKPAPHCIKCGLTIGPGDSYTAKDNGQYVVLVHTVCPGTDAPIIRVPIRGTISAKGIEWKPGYHITPAPPTGD